MAAFCTLIEWVGLGGVVAFAKISRTETIVSDLKVQTSLEVKCSLCKGRPRSRFWCHRELGKNDAKGPLAPSTANT